MGQVALLGGPWQPRAMGAGKGQVTAAAMRGTGKAYVLKLGSIKGTDIGSFVTENDNEVFI